MGIRPPFSGNGLPWACGPRKDYTYTYDTLGRPLRVDVSDGTWIQYGFNTIDQSTKLKYRYNGTTRTERTQGTVLCVLPKGQYLAKHTEPSPVFLTYTKSR